MSKHTFVVLAYKESDMLEECIKSVLRSKYRSNVVIATSTPNKYIESIAQKYNLDIKINKGTRGIGGDFDFASNCVDSTLVTIAHQDDIYDEDYSKEVVKMYEKYPDSTIIFTDYYEIRNEKKEFTNINLKIKRILLFPLRSRFLSKFKLFKRASIRLGNAICCPAVTFVTKNNDKEKFLVDMKCDIDWYAWERISRKKGRFIYIKKPLMGHRISVDTTTTKIINNGIRTKEDYIMFRKFWPKEIAKILTKIYKNSEKSNVVK